MKKIFLISIISLLFNACGSQQTTSNPEKKETVALKPEKDEDGEWDLDVIDTQYNYFLNAIAQPMTFYTESTLKARNKILVNEWNAHFISGRYQDIIQSRIDYDSEEKYGLKFEYKLYQVFAYVQWKYKLRLLGLSNTEVR